MQSKYFNVGTKKQRRIYNGVNNIDSIPLDEEISITGFDRIKLLFEQEIMGLPKEYSCDYMPWLKVCTALQDLYIRSETDTQKQFFRTMFHVVSKNHGYNYDEQ